MKAMVLTEVGSPLILMHVPTPIPGPNQVLVKIQACGVCRTDLHVIDGELPDPALPLILGHQVVGRIVETGKEVSRFKIGERVGCPWLGKSCRNCFYCMKDQENLCEHASYRGYGFNGGFAEYCIADQDYIFLIPSQYSAEHAAPLLCAGLIGYRSYRMAGAFEKIGFYGFGAAAHILVQIALHQKKQVYAFTRKDDEQTQSFARNLGAIWSGASDQLPPTELDAAIIFAPDGKLVPMALQAVRKGGNVICAGIYMTDIPSFPYRLLYGERSLKSVTNLTRQDGEDFFKLADQVFIDTSITIYPLSEANQALNDLKQGKISGSIVLKPGFMPD